MTMGAWVTGVRGVEREERCGGSRVSEDAEIPQMYYIGKVVDMPGVMKRQAPRIQIR